ncbi:hypothetical protein PIB30_037788 [Stylosanthes scabra]|uniref:Uncharacterized protein n=1 Tax=Stylosanthes scabra TaxID=79078 RepID=A0ABU6XDG6_9FABA|nr:hypothetical protein [Stylosanthes scabra]
MHESVRGFVSQCGWNSVLESVCAGVPILVWPLASEQHLAAKLVVEEIRVGVRVETSDGSVREFVRREGLRKTIMELMEGEKGKEAMKKVSEWACMAKKAVKKGGSSWSNLEALLRPSRNDYIDGADVNAECEEDYIGVAPLMEKLEKEKLKDKESNLNLFEEPSDSDTDEDDDRFTGEALQIASTTSRTSSTSIDQTCLTVWQRRRRCAMLLD